MITFLFKIFFRHLNRYKLFNTINILGLAVGLAAVIIIGSWLHFELTYDASVKNADRLFRVIQQLKYEDTDEWVAPTPGPLAAVLQNSVHGISKTCRVHYTPDLIFKANGKSLVEDKVLFVDSTFLSMFSFPGQYLVNNSVFIKDQVILSRSVAKKYFGQKDPLGEFMLISGEHQVIVTGVMEDLPANCHFNFDILLPMPLAIEMHHEIFDDVWHEFDELDTYVELQPGTDTGFLNDRIAGIKSKYVKDCKDRLSLQSIRSIHTRTDLKYDQANTIEKSKLFIFTSVAVFLLVVAVINFMIFSLALSADQTRETCIRRINGSSVFNIVSGQLLGSFITVLLSLALSLIIVELITPLIQRYTVTPVTINYLLKSGLFHELVAGVILIGLAGGLIPGLRLAGLRASALFHSPPIIKIEKNNLLKSLVIIQFVISLSLLIFAYTVIAQLKFARNTDIGFDKDRLITVTLFEESKNDLIRNLESFVDEIKSINGIENVTFSCSSPARIGTSAGEVDWDGRKDGEMLKVQWNSVFYNYFSTIGAHIVAGRDFSENFPKELADENTAVFILNEMAVKEMNLKNHEVIGKSFRLYGSKGPVIGVVSDFHYKSFREKIQPMAFFMHPWYYRDIIIRTGPGTLPPLASIENIFNKFLPGVPFDYSFVEDEYDDIYKGELSLLRFSSAFTFLMIFMSSLGLSSISLLMLRKKTREIGIRKINGASVTDILKLLFGYFGKWILLSVIISFPVSLILTSRWLENFAYRIDFNVMSFILPVLIIIIIAGLSIFAQVINASRTNPADILRHE